MCPVCARACIVCASGVFNIEGGCYAKVIGITPDTPPGIHQALR